MACWSILSGYCQSNSFKGLKRPSLALFKRRSRGQFERLVIYPYSLYADSAHEYMRRAGDESFADILYRAFSLPV